MNDDPFGFQIIHKEWTYIPPSDDPAARARMAMNYMKSRYLTAPWSTSEWCSTRDEEEQS